MDYKKEHEEAMELYKRSDKSYWKLRKEARKIIESLQSELTASKEENTRLMIKVKYIAEWLQEFSNHAITIDEIEQSWLKSDELLADTSQKE